MTEDKISEFFHEFRNQVDIEAEVESDFQLAAFMNVIANELVEIGFIDGFEFCHYRARGVRVDGFWFNEDGVLSLFIADFDSRTVVESLTKTMVDAIFRRLTNFFKACLSMQPLYLKLEETSPEYRLAREITERKKTIDRVNCVIFTERKLSKRLSQLNDINISRIPCSFHIWDISRLHRQHESRGYKEPLNIDFVEQFGVGIPCLKAHLGSNTYPSYLVVLPGSILAKIYQKFGARLLEQNVRCFLQARGKVNKGIRATILNEPTMFFAYNNGITATAQKVNTRLTPQGIELKSVTDLQIVNGGQTTASLYHTGRKDKVPLEEIFVQLKLSVIEFQNSEEVISRISEYSNTQNRINAADFFSNHPFHIRMEGFSRRILAPTSKGSLRETKWFYERARGQYLDAQVNLAPSNKKRFLAEYPRLQKFTKTDLAKFENVWDVHPKWVNLGAQKNFAQYAQRIGKEWSKNQKFFNERYFKRVIARGIVFRSTERLISAQHWYKVKRGYRANIVAYTIALISKLSSDENESEIDYDKIWTSQSVYESLLSAIGLTARFVHERITNPPEYINNISEWCKKEGCWDNLIDDIEQLKDQLPSNFWTQLVPKEVWQQRIKSAKREQGMVNGIEAQTKVVQLGPNYWARILAEGSAKKLFSPKEMQTLKIASQMTRTLPNVPQSRLLLTLRERSKYEGIK